VSGFSGSSSERTILAVVPLQPACSIAALLATTATETMSGQARDATRLPACPIFGTLSGVFLGRAQRQSQSVHTALLRRPEFRRQGGVDGARSRDTANALECGTDHKDTVMGLAPGLRSRMSGVMRAVVLDGQHGGREGLGQCRPQAIGAGGGGGTCHGRLIDLLSDPTKPRIMDARYSCCNPDGTADVKKITVATRARSRADPTAVFGLLQDGSTWPDWAMFDSFEQERPGQPTPFGVGAIRVFITKVSRAREEVVEFVPDRRLSYILLSGFPLRDYRADVELQRTDTNGTVINWSASFYPKYFGTGWMWRLFISLVIASIARSLASAAEHINTIN
jgi:hypothetical protein